MSRRLIRANSVAVCFCAGLIFSGPVWADETKNTGGTFSIQIENDLFGGDSDRNYTNGVRATWLSAEGDVPVWVSEPASHVPFFESDGKLRVLFGLGQNLYTPTDITVRNLQPNDRPYAGWLYGSVGLVSDNGHILDNLQLDIGVVGPAAMGSQVQEFVHDLIDTRDPSGWDNQIDNEPGLVLFYERKWRSLYEFGTFLPGYGVDATPHAGAALGNVFTYGAAGLTLRFGKNLPADYGPPRIRPSLPGSSFFISDGSFGWYLFAGIEGRAIARNIFLDGNTFGGSHSVEKNPLVGDLQIGAAVSWDQWRLSYTQVYRTREFDTQSNDDIFGSVSLSYRF